jgi:acyl dehydratase
VIERRDVQVFDGCAEATGDDHQWIHVDPEKAGGGFKKVQLITPVRVGAKVDSSEKSAAVIESIVRYVD